MAKRKQRPVKEQLDIIIPVYGQAGLLQKCLFALSDAAGDVSYHVILVDDCGPEQEQLTEVYHSLNGNSRLLKNKQNSGFARSVNAGAAAGKAPFILILNSDCVLQPGAIPAMLKEFDDPEVGIVGCKLLFADSRLQNERKIQHA